MRSEVSVRRRSLLFALILAAPVSHGIGQELAWENLGFPTQDIRTLAVALDDHPSRSLGSSVLYAGTYESGIFRSLDGGASWNPFSEGLRSGAQITVLLVHQAPKPSRAPITRYETTVYAGTAAGVFRSRNGDRWVEINTGLDRRLGGLYISSLARDSSGALYAGTQYGLYKSANDGESWAQINPAGNQYTWFETQIVRTTAVAVDPTTNAVYAGLGGSLLLWSDPGGRWLNLLPHRNSVLQDIFYPRVVALAPSAATILTMGTLDCICGMPPGPGVYRSLDGGETWKDMSEFGIPDDLIIVDDGRWVAAFNYSAPSDGASKWPGVRKGVSESFDGGESWHSMGSGLPSEDLFYIRKVVLDPGSPETIYAVTTRGLFRLGPARVMGPRVVPKRGGQ